MVRNFGEIPWLQAQNGSSHGIKNRKNTMVTPKNQSQPWYCENFTYHGWTLKWTVTLVFLHGNIPWLDPKSGHNLGILAR